MARVHVFHIMRPQHRVGGKACAAEISLNAPVKAEGKTEPAGFDVLGLSGRSAIPRHLSGSTNPLLGSSIVIDVVAGSDNECRSGHRETTAANYPTGPPPPHDRNADTWGTEEQPSSARSGWI
jgi:hypothetical protein